MTDTAVTAPFGLSFYKRVPHPDGYVYQHLTLIVRRGDCRLPAFAVPNIGDVLSIPNKEFAGLVMVVARQFEYSSWGSANWPHVEPLPITPTAVTVIVESCYGVFKDEVTIEEESG